MQITLLPHEEAIWQKTLWLIVIILMLQLKGLMLQGQLFQKKMAFHTPDIQYGDEQASLKFYKDAKSSAMRQSDPGYGNQHRIVPSDQVDDAKAELAQKSTRKQG